MGWFSDFVSDPIGTTVDTVSSAVDAVTNVASDALKPAVAVGKWSIENPVEAAAIGAGGYYGLGALGAAESGTALTATEAGGAEALSGIDLGGAGASPNSWLNATTSTMAGSATSGWTAGQILSTTSAGLNLATSGIKLASLGKTMNASTPTVDGLTGGLAASPIQTPAGLITTTPQGPITAGPAAATQSGFMGMDTQTLIVIAVAVGGIWYLMKHAKA